MREALGLSTGECVVFTRLDDGTTVMRKKTRSVIDLKWLLKPGRGKRKVAMCDMSIGRS